MTSILANPDEDPHLFEASPSTARQIADARIVVYNGADYDPWMEKLFAASPNPDRVTIVAADLTGHKAGDNPHLWYDPATLPAVAAAIEAELAKRDPGGRGRLQGQPRQFRGFDGCYRRPSRRDPRFARRQRP